MPDHSCKQRYIFASLCNALEKSLVVHRLKIVDHQQIENCSPSCSSGRCSLKPVHFLEDRFLHNDFVNIYGLKKTGTEQVSVIVGGWITAKGIVLSRVKFFTRFPCLTQVFPCFRLCPCIDHKFWNQKPACLHYNVNHIGNEFRGWL